MDGGFYVFKRYFAGLLGCLWFNLALNLACCFDLDYVVIAFGELVCVFYLVALCRVGLTLCTLV